MNIADSKNPYLKKHASNPVGWFQWSEATLTLAQNKNLPLFISIGYASCHWCHVMNRESFQNKQVASILNNYFIPIKVDREEHPSLDAVYLRAATLLEVQGGWPLNVFATPTGAPYFVGTYFPLNEKHGMASFFNVMQHCYNLWQKKNVEVLKYATSVEEAIVNSFNSSVTKKDVLLSFKNNKEKPSFLENKSKQSEIEVLYFSLKYPTQGFFPEDRNFAEMHLKYFDAINGGFKFQSASKFPHFLQLQHLLKIATREKRADLWKVVTFSLQKMLCGGLYDFVEGGFFRYATTYEWKVPHFEKTLYDNALAISLLAELANSKYHSLFSNNDKATNNSSGKTKENEEDYNSFFYLHKAVEIFLFLKRTLKHKNKLYFTAIDAESDKKEGVYYTLLQDQLDGLLIEFASLHKKLLMPLGVNNKKILLQKAEFFFTTFFEYKVLPEMGERIMISCKAIINKKLQALKNGDINISNKNVCKMISTIYKLLKNLRSSSKHPQLDKKNLLGWNSLLLSAFCKLATTLFSKNLNNNLLETKNISWQVFLEKEKKSLQNFAEEVANEALELGNAIEKNFAAKNGMYFRRIAEKEKTLAGELSDYAAYGSALCELDQLAVYAKNISSSFYKSKTSTLKGVKTDRIKKAQQIATTLLQYFYNSDNGIFYETMRNKKAFNSLLYNKTEKTSNNLATKKQLSKSMQNNLHTLFNFANLSDDVEPCGNSLVAQLFLKLSVYFPEADYLNVLEYLFLASQKALNENSLPSMLSVLHVFRLGCWRLTYADENLNANAVNFSKKHFIDKKNTRKNNKYWWIKPLLQSELAERVYCLPFSIAVKNEKQLKHLVKKKNVLEKKFNINQSMVLLCKYAMCINPVYNEDDFLKIISNI